MKSAVRPELSDVFFALSDPTRLRVVAQLGAGARRASDLAETVGASRPGMSRHVRILKSAGVVREETDPEDGRARQLVLDPGALQQIENFVQQLRVEQRRIEQRRVEQLRVEHRGRERMEGEWESRLDAFADLAETRAAEKKSTTKKAKRVS